MKAEGGIVRMLECGRPCDDQERRGSWFLCGLECAWCARGLRGNVWCVQCVCVCSVVRLGEGEGCDRTRCATASSLFFAGFLRVLDELSR